MAKDFAAVNRMELEAGLATVGNGKDELVSKFVKAWENQTARRALKGGTGISMALTLAACGGGSDDTSTTAPAAPAAPAAPTTPTANLIDFVTDGITEISGADPVVVIPNPTAGADDLSTTIGAGGTGTLTLQFADADDTVALAAASDLTGYTTLAIVSGTVDVTAVSLAGITSITVSSGVVLTAEQFLALDNGVTGGSADSSVSIVITTAADAAAVIAAVANLGGTLDAASVSFTLSADSELTELALATQNAALDAAVTEAGIPNALPQALVAVDAAVDAVVAKTEEIEAYLVDALGNEDVAALAGAGAETATEGNLAAANVANAGVLALEMGGVADGAAFVALTDGQQATQIAAAQANLQAAIDIAAANPALDVTGSTIALIDAADAAGTALENAMDAYDLAASNLVGAQAAAIAANELTAVGGEPAASGEVNIAADGVLTTFITDVGVIALTVVDPDTSKIALVTAAELAADIGGGATVAAAQEILDGVTTSPTLEAWIAAFNAEIDAFEAETAAQDALADAINAVYNSADPDGLGDPAALYNLSYADLAAGDNDVVQVDGDNVVTITFGGDSAATGVVGAGDFASLDDYGSALAALTTAEEALADFNDAVAAWEATQALEDGLAALEEQLGTGLDAADAGTLFGDAAAAFEAISNATTDTPAGLGIEVIDTTAGGDINFADAADDALVYFWADDFADDGAVVVSAFGADGTDYIYMGAGEYTLVELGATEVVTEAVGSATSLEIFAKETGADVVLSVEGIPTAGNGSSATVDFTTVTLTGVTLADLTFDAATGILSAEATIA